MNRIKQLRKEKGLSIDRLSEELKNKGYSISPASISKYEREQRKPKIQSWQALANFFGVSVPYIQGLTNNKGIASNNKTIADVISTLYEVLIYLGRHAETGYIPQARLNGLKLSKLDDIRLQNTLMFLLNLIDYDENHFEKYDDFVGDLSKQVISHFDKYGTLSSNATDDDVSDIIELYYQLVKSYLSNQITDNDVIDRTISNLISYVVGQLNVFLFDKESLNLNYVRDNQGNIEKIINNKLDEELPEKVNEDVYENTLKVLNDAINKLLSMRKGRTKDQKRFL